MAYSLLLLQPSKGSPERPEVDLDVVRETHLVASTGDVDRGRWAQDRDQGRSGSGRESRLTGGTSTLSSGAIRFLRALM